MQNIKQTSPIADMVRLEVQVQVKKNVPIDPPNVYTKSLAQA